MMDELKSWLTVVLSSIALVTAIWNWVSAGSKKTASELEAYKKADAEEKKLMMTAITELGRRIQTVESDVKHMPDSKAFMDMRVAMSELSGKIGRMEESQIGMARTVARIDDYLMNTRAAS
jgi:hypothetical protein